MPDYPPTKRGFLMKGAIIELKEGGLLPVTPSLNIFQYNPEQLSVAIGIAATGRQDRDDDGRADPPNPNSPEFNGAVNGASLASQPYDPRLTFNLNVTIDAIDDMDEGNKLGVATGIADRLASLELLTYPNPTLLDGLLDAVGDAISGALGLRSTADPPLISIQLFWFGPGKLLPVRITSMSIDETAFHGATLYPIRAKVSMGLRVLREHEIDEAYPSTSLAAKIAKGCYIFTREQKSLLATIGGPIRLVDSALTAINPDLGDIL